MDKPYPYDRKDISAKFLLAKLPAKTHENTPIPEGFIVARGPLKDAHGLRGNFMRGARSGKGGPSNGAQTTGKVVATARRDVILGYACRGLRG